MQYLTSWHFWLAVIVVALITNFAWNKFTGKGQAVL